MKEALQCCNKGKLQPPHSETHWGACTSSVPSTSPVPRPIAPLPGAECPSSSDCVPKLNMQTPVLTVFVVDSTSCFMDKRWCSMLRQSALELAELDSSMSWLSTLGGACSALGDHNLAWADRAAAISARQLVIANRLGDPAVVARCRLYAAIALIQKKDWKTAAAIIKREYQAVKKLPAEQQDGRLVKMCLGIWTKLSYERSMEKPT
ncbi:Protein of unknown function DUF4807 [Trinorchestia longiramus]|nr:Protein of unknown function DUF4807 [Trinorchestia longiramus]